MKSASNIVLKLLGILLLTAAVLKGWQLLTEPMANKDIWTNRAFLIFTVEFEIALGIWLLSGLFKKAAWLATISCFTLFCFVTLYKSLSGAESCGCFGSVHVNPWITLLAIDLPAVLALVIFRPKLSLSLSLPRRRESIEALVKALIHEFITPLPSIVHFAAGACIGVLTLGITTPILALNHPAKVTASYEVLEPETWVGKELPILQHIDIADKLRTGNWLILLYHHDCSDCAKAIPMYGQMARDLAGNEDFLRIAFVEVPPYGNSIIGTISPCTYGQLHNMKDWFVTTPSVVLLADSIVVSAWEGKAPKIDRVLETINAKLEVQNLLES